MIRKIAHIGIAVSSIEQVQQLFVDLLGLTGEEVGQNEQMRWMFVTVGESAIEFLEPLDPNGAVGRFLDRKGEGVHHVALETDDIEGDLQHLKEKGILLIDEKKKPGAHGSWIAFLHPRSCNGVLLELVEPAKSS